jgi:CHAT domain-containing protein
LAVLLVLALALVVGVAVSRSHRHVSSANPLQAVIDARPRRTFSARLSIATEYRPCRSRPAREGGSVPEETCTADDEDSPDFSSLVAAGAESSDPDTLQASAVAEMIWGDTTEAVLNDAIERLDKAARLTQHPVPVLVDLSGAHLARAQRGQSARDLVVGLELARLALAREPRNEAALFNAALALESLTIDGEAAKAWGAYLAVDSTSNLADEARHRRQALLQQWRTPQSPTLQSPPAQVDDFAQQFPQEARLLGWEHMLGDWGAAVEQRQAARADSLLALVERLGNALERRGGDASLADAVRAIRSAAANPIATQKLAVAHRAYAVGQELFASKHHPAAQDSFERVLNARPPSPVLRQSALGGIAGVLVYASRFPEADSICRSLLAQVDSVRHPALTARLQWMLGTSLLRNARYPDARARYRAAERTFQRLGEKELFAAMVGYEGETAYLQRDTLAAYLLLHRTAQLLRRDRNSIYLHNAFVNLARHATLDGMPSAALQIQNEGVALAMRTHSPDRPLEALIARAQVRAIGGDSVGAADDINAALPLVQRIEPGETHDFFSARLRFSLALLQSGKDTVRAMVAIDSAIAAYAKSNIVWHLQGLIQRAKLRVEAGNLSAATVDLEAATARIRTLSDKESEGLRSAMIEEARGRFDQLVMLHLQAGRYDEALRVLERGRVSFSRGPAVPATRELATTLRGQVALEYALIGDTLLTWTVHDGKVDFLRQTLNRDEFLRRIERVGVALESTNPPATFTPDLQQLYDVLVRPVDHSLGARDTPLVIVADGEVTRIPFAVLFDSARKRYLLEDHSIRFAASLSDAVRPARTPSTGPALLVANPAFDLRYHPTLDRLGGAAMEVVALQQVYRQAVVLKDSGATRDAFKANAQRASVIHYAGHAVFDDTRPERSYLVLAGEGDTGQLTAQAVDSLDLTGVRLVVLSACRTLRARDGRSGGFAGLSGALLAAGAGGVVGSVWNANDQLTQPLTVAFHREYRRHPGNPAEALRQAQLSLRHSADPKLSSPAAWGGFRYMGR